MPLERHSLNVLLGFELGVGVRACGKRISKLSVWNLPMESSEAKMGAVHCYLLFPLGRGWQEGEQVGRTCVDCDGDWFSFTWRMSPVVVSTSRFLSILACLGMSAVSFSCLCRSFSIRLSRRWQYLDSSHAVMRDVALPHFQLHTVDNT